MAQKAERKKPKRKRKRKRNGFCKKFQVRLVPCGFGWCNFQIIYYSIVAVVWMQCFVLFIMICTWFLKLMMIFVAAGRRWGLSRQFEWPFVTAVCPKPRSGNTKSCCCCCCSSDDPQAHLAPLQQQVGEPEASRGSHWTTQSRKHLQGQQLEKNVRKNARHFGGENCE